MSWLSAGIRRLGLGGFKAPSLNVNPPMRPFVPMQPAAQMTAQTAAIAGDPTAANNTGADAQRAAIERMRRISDTGRSDIDEASLKSSQRRARAEEQTRNATANRSLLKRGMGGSGAALASSLQNAQSAADRNTQDIANINAQAEARRIGATQQLGSMGQGFTQQQLSNAQLQNQANQFNAGQLNNASQFNTQQQNIASGANFQGINQYLGSQADMAFNADVNNMGFIRPMAQQGVQTAAGWFGQFLPSDRNMKTDIKDGGGDADDFMDSLKAYKYRYKDDDENHLGIMAQDVEREEPSLVEDIEGKKHVNMTMSVPKLLASVARLNERLKAVENA